MGTENKNVEQKEIKNTQNIRKAARPWSSSWIILSVIVAWIWLIGLVIGGIIYGNIVDSYFPFIIASILGFISLSLIMVFLILTLANDTSRMAENMAEIKELIKQQADKE